MAIGVLAGFICAFGKLYPFDIEPDNDLHMVGIEGANAKKKCALCGRATEEVKVTRNINGIDYYFDKEECEVIFRRLESVYGDAFFQQ